jgi:hypothetical protein
MNIFHNNLDSELSFHPYLEEENPILQTTDINELSNIFFYGKRGIGKYYNSLQFIKRFSPSKLKYNKKMYINEEYYIKVSDIHFEIDMSTLGCNCKILWNNIQKQIINSMEFSKLDRAIILCKNFQDINKDLLRNLKNIMLKKCVYIFLAEHINFIPNVLVQTSHIVSMRKVKKTQLNSFFKYTKNNHNDIDNLVSYNHKNIKNNHNITYLDHKYITNIITYLEDNTDFTYLELRERIYKLLIFQCNIDECIWYFMKYYIKKYSNMNVNDLLIEMYNFFMFFNYNYRPIYHLENIILYIYEQSRDNSADI